jgi:hypothetical protein
MNRRTLLLRRREYSKKVLGYGPIAYWPMWETSGSISYDISGNGRDGVYTGVTLGQEGIGDRRTCPLFDGVNDFNDTYSASLAAAFNGAEGTIAIWAKVTNAGIWAGATFRASVTLIADGNNLVILRKDSSPPDSLEWIYIAGGTTKLRAKTGLTTTGWMHLALSWSKSDDEVIAYYDGVQEGAVMTGLGTWVGALSSGGTVLGAQSVPSSNTWDGYLAHGAVWDYPLTPAQTVDLAEVR